MISGNQGFFFLWSRSRADHEAGRQRAVTRALFHFVRVLQRRIPMANSVPILRAVAKPLSQRFVDSSLHHKQNEYEDTLKTVHHVCHVEKFLLVLERGVLIQ